MSGSASLAALGLRQSRSCRAQHRHVSRQADQHAINLMGSSPLVLQVTALSRDSSAPYCNPSEGLLGTRMEHPPKINPKSRSSPRVSRGLTFRTSRPRGLTSRRGLSCRALMRAGTPSDLLHTPWPTTPGGTRAFPSNRPSSLPRLKLPRGALKSASPLPLVTRNSHWMKIFSCLQRLTEIFHFLWLAPPC